MDLHEQLQHTSETLLVSAPIHSFVHKFTTQPAVEAQQQRLGILDFHKSMILEQKLQAPPRRLKPCF
jgi:hypothetical protein